MKKLFFLPVVLLALSIPFQQCNTPKAISIKRTTFPVCDVKRATKILPTQAYRDVLLEKMVTERNQKAREAAILQDKTLTNEQRYNLRWDSEYQPPNVPIRVLEAAAQIDTPLIAAGFHPFVAAVHTAYAYHYPLVISPDMIWLLITQGFANHINKYPEEMRRYFVDFKGKKLLNVDRPSFSKGSADNNWPGVFPEFGDSIEANTGPALLDLVTGDFSTTSPAEKIAFQITLMDAMKSYFTYSVTTLCGIPEITLEGSVQDWQKIEAKTQELAQYELSWWTDELLPVLREFTNTAAGRPNQEFWQAIYKMPFRGSGSPDISGWILNFFPYKDLGGNLVQFIGAKKPDGNNPGIPAQLTATTDEFTSGLSQADFIWNYYGTFYKMEFVAGFVGFRQDSQTLALRPEISWAVIDKQQLATADEIDDYHNGGNKEYLEGKNKQ
jgi:hypothetical protein